MALRARNKDRYQGVQDRVAELAANDSSTIHVVPWWFVAVASESRPPGRLS
jgi:hypothetical protein